MHGELDTSLKAQLLEGFIKFEMSNHLYPHKWLWSNSVSLIDSILICAIPKTTNLCGELVVSWPGIPLGYILMFLSTIGNFVHMSQ